MNQYCIYLLTQNDYLKKQNKKELPESFRVYGGFSRYLEKDLILNHMTMHLSFKVNCIEVW